MRNLRHPNVIRILDVADDPQNVCFIMEFAPGGELRAYVERRGFLPEEESRQFFKQIVRAVHYVHSKKIIHRDLKLENILLDSQNRCKIVDFGLSDYVSAAERTVTDAGTLSYLAPEVYNGTSKDTDPYKIDSWGLGVILFALAHGRLPFSRPDTETCAKLEAEGGLPCREEITEGYQQILRGMLTVSVRKRASVDQIIVDPWVTKYRYMDLGVSESDEGERSGGDVSPARTRGDTVETAATAEPASSQPTADDAPTRRRPSASPSPGTRVRPAANRAQRAQQRNPRSSTGVLPLPDGASRRSTDNRRRTANARLNSPSPSPSRAAPERARARTGSMGRH